VNSDTAIVPTEAKIMLAGIPKTPIPRIAGAIIRCATEPDLLTSAALWILPDDGPVFRINNQILSEGVYKLLNQRLLTLGRLANKVMFTFATLADIGSLLGRKFVVAVIGLGLGLWIRNYMS